MTKKMYYVMIACIQIGFINGATIVSGQEGTLGMPFPFTVGPTAYNPSQASLFIGASEPITDNQFKSQAISFVSRNAPAVRGITPEKVTLNNASQQTNPLYGQQIAFIALADNNPFVVTAASNTQVTFVRNVLSSNQMVLQSPPLKNTTDVTGGIVGLSALPGIQASINQNLQVPAFESFSAAIRPAIGAFGQVGSGIATGQVFVTNISEDENAPILEYSLKQTLFVSLDTTSLSVAVNNPLTSIDNDTLGKPVIMKSSVRSNALYTGLFVTGGSNANDGAFGVVLNQMSNIALSSALESDSIIGGIAPNIQVSIHFLETLLTSTYLDYLIVVGGVGSPNATAQSVWALPITKNGILAKKNAVPLTTFTPPPLSLFTNRFFPDTEMAMNPGDLFSPTAPDSYRARVGGNSTLPGDITALFTFKDAVFVSVALEGNNQQAGVFFSQMIFDSLGRANGWTDWERAYGITTGVSNIAFNNKLADMWYFPGDNPQALTTLWQTSWQSNTNTLSSFYVELEATFSPQDGGIQGLVDFNWQHPSLSQTVGTRISPLVITGFNQVVLAESGADQGNIFTANTTLLEKQTFTNGALTGLTTPTQKIIMRGGALEQIGAIVTADIVSDGTYSWLIVGGSGGVAVLANPDGTGWDQGTLQAGFVNLPATLAWHVIGSFSFVRKVAADKNGLLYILANDGLFRLSASVDQFKLNSQSTFTTVADRSVLKPYGENFGNFSDLIVSGKFATIATSVGLFRVGNGADISQAPNVAAVNWTPVPMPESSGAATRFYLVAPSAATNSFADDPRGAGLYVVNATTCDVIGRIYRFALAGSINTTGINDATMQNPGDLFVEGRPSLYLNCSIYVNYVFTDGAFLGIMRSAYFPTKQPAFLEIVNPRLRTGVRKAVIDSEAYATTGVRMGPIIRRSASGSVMAGGSNLLVGE